MVRDFPQRWTTFFQDVFVPIRMGGLWYDGEDNVHSMGVLICLECLKLVTEDCTDSDYNAKVCATGSFVLTVRKVCNAKTNHVYLIIDFHITTKRCLDWVKRSFFPVSAITICYIRTRFCLGSVQEYAAQYENISHFQWTNAIANDF